MTGTVFIHQRLRPLRLTFLVRPNDGEALQTVCEFNTCLWGGCFNGIVPAFTRTPQWFVDEPFPPPAASEILAGYITAFEPDFLVLTRTEPDLRLPLPAERVVTLDNVYGHQHDQPVGIGLSVIDLYRHLYDREFQFVRRHPVKVVRPTSRLSRFAPFIAACFGSFPTAEGLNHFRGTYQEAFEANDLPVDENNLFDLMTGELYTPLRMGYYGLNVRRRGWSWGPALFFMDATQPKDLIDFWNLRALGWRILPIPRQWADSLVDQCRDFVQKHHVPLHGNLQIKQRTTVLKSRSVSKEEFEAFAQKLRIQGGTPPSLALVAQHWYPRIWDEWARNKDHVERCDLHGGEGETECRADGSRVAFRELSPTFVEQHTATDKPAWVNVVQIRDYSTGSEFAQVLPPDLGGLDHLFETYDFNTSVASSEGVVLLCHFRDWKYRWSLPNGLSVFRLWLEKRGVQAELSGAGRVAMQLIRSLGGPRGAWAIGNVELLKLLNNMAHGVMELPSDDGQESGKPPTRGRIVRRRPLWKLLLKVNKGNPNRAEHHLRVLLDRKVLRVGLQLQCLQCSQRNWYGLGEIADRLRCERCLQEFSFPSWNPPIETWSYRAQGPFSVENFAQGSYTVALAVQFLVAKIHAEATWVPGTKLIDGHGLDMEIDFGIWWRKSSFDTDAPLLVLGECKSFNRFERKDLKRVSVLADRFPGATLVFATLRPSLEPEEKTRIAALARQGRRRLKTEEWKTPVMVLTSHELMSDMGPPYCWRNAGGRFATFAGMFRGYGGLPELCDATQQLHLDMESYAQWQQRELERLRLKRSRKQATGGK